jgi:predicted transposase YdaD
VAWHDKDSSGKWLIQHHGDSILRLGGVRDIVSWRPLQAEVVHPGRPPDGLLEVKLAGQARPDLFLLELETYPDSRLAEQVVRKQTLVYLDRGVLPEALVLILHHNPRGQIRAPTEVGLQSRLGFSQLQARWRVVELWTLSAEELLASGDVGLIPWVPLTRYSGPPEVLLQQCRERIDRQAGPGERVNLLAVTQVMATLQYNNPQLMTILGGSQVMIESPLIKEMMAKSAAQALQKSILRFLERRFGPVPEDVAVTVRTIYEENKLDELAEVAAYCPDVQAFRASLQGSQR